MELCRIGYNLQKHLFYFIDLDKKIKLLREKGVRVLAYINPNLNSGGTLFAEGASKGHLVKNTSSQPYLTDFGEFTCGTVDLTSPTARDWYKGKRNYILAYNYKYNIFIHV